MKNEKKRTQAYRKPVDSVDDYYIASSGRSSVSAK